MYLLLHASTSADNHSKNRPKVCLFRSCVKRDFPLHLPALRGQAHPLSEGDQIGLVDQFNRRVGRSRRTKKRGNPPPWTRRALPPPWVWRMSHGVELVSGRASGLEG